MTIIGRQYEQRQLQKIFQSDEAEFIAIYGRRRVGKTHLIREFFDKKSCVFFRSSGIHKGSLKKQLEKFKKEIENTFYKGRRGTQLSTFSNWHDAFEALKDAIDLFAEKQKVAVFLDEIPWMSTPKSGLLEALDYYWNRHWSEDKRIKLIICGSAASWIIDNVLHDTGGLHNRVTLRLPMEPFTLSETKAYLNHKNINYSNEQILTLYMCLGGIPFYLNFVEKGLSAIQNINNICFSKKGTLYDEFELLFASLFKKHEMHEEIIKFIASKREGVARYEIESYFKYKGGRLTRRLKELEEAGFIIAFTPWKKERGVYYKVIDEYTLFYLTWIAKRAASRISKNIDDRYWEVLSAKSAWKTWAGLSFEAICFKHINQIKKTFQIPYGSDVSSWRYISDKEEESGAQIDLIFDRPDNIVNLCEIKYCSSPFVIDKKYARHILSREKIYCKVAKTNKQIFHSMIVSGGLKKTMYSEEIIASYATLNDLFKA
jgi:AAA+ ATPase superfamily predicted ATPase